MSFRPIHRVNAGSVVLRISGNQSVAEDLVQELFVRVWNRSACFDPSKGVLGVWIMSVARNLAIDYLRSREGQFSRKMRPIEQFANLHSAPASSGPNSFLDNLSITKTAISTLSGNQRRVLELAYFEGRSHSEIAARLHKPLGTVKSWMRSALMRLRLAINSPQLRIPRPRQITTARQVSFKAHNIV